MNLQEFEQADYNTNLQVLQNGVFLTTRQEGKYTIFLYRVYDFYVEAFYLQKYSHIAGVKAFSGKDEDKLTAYRDFGNPSAALCTSAKELWKSR